MYDGLAENRSSLRPLPTVQAVRVNSLGKWKTALQMVAMVLLLVLRKAEQLFPMGPKAIKLLHVATVVSWLTLWMATILALWSLYNCAWAGVGGASSSDYIMRIARLSLSACFSYVPCLAMLRSTYVDC